MNYFYCKEGEFDAFLFHEGTFYKSHEFLGAHKVKGDDGDAVRFVVWAPNAKHITLMGDFNDWNEDDLPLKRIEESGLFSICVYGVEVFDTYKYRIVAHNDEVRIKADPYAFHAELKPKSGSKVYDIKNYKWRDKKWMNKRKKIKSNEEPMSIYEVNLASWNRKENGEYYSYKDLAKELVAYVKKMGFTHVELMPIMEHPFDGSWGYQQTGYFAPTSRFGTPEDFMHLVDEFHRKNIGVILDWVPVHFCKDDHGLARFDGTHLFEPADPLLAENEGWGTLHFDYAKPEVRSFLISNALYWLDYYHIDGLRIDAVANMLYLDFGGEDIKNIHGGNENLDAINFIETLNTVVGKYFPDALMIAEDSTSWPMVTKPVSDGGLGFDYKWNMGWMNDTLEYIESDPFFRKGNQNALTFGITYAFNENFILPLSHDEVVHGKKSLLDKMPGTYEEKFNNLRLYFLYMYFFPGKKLLFMGGEFGQFIEWNEWQALDWFLLEYDAHEKMQNFVKDLNKLYVTEKPLFQQDNSFDGFEWIEHENHDESIIAFERVDKKGNKLIGIFNFTPVMRDNYRIGVSEAGRYRTLMASGHRRYGGDLARVKTYKSEEVVSHGRENSIVVDVPGLSGLIFKIRRD